MTGLVVSLITLFADNFGLICCIVYKRGHHPSKVGSTVQALSDSMKIAILSSLFLASSALAAYVQIEYIAQYRVQGRVKSNKRWANVEHDAAQRVIDNIGHASNNEFTASRSMRGDKLIVTNRVPAPSGFLAEQILNRMEVTVASIAA